MSESLTWPELSDEDDLGPVEYVVITLPTEPIGAVDFDAVLGLVDRDVIRVLDLELVSKDEAGSMSIADVSTLDPEAYEPLLRFQGASSALLDRDDLESLGDVLEPGSTAAILVYEQTWLASMSSALRQHGARIVATGIIEFEDLEAALDSGGGSEQ